jgi:hypothetical protein
VFDLVSGSIVCSISVGEIMNIEPILNEEGRPSGRYYITGKYHRGILDLLGPKLGHKFEVLQLPAANSVKAATDKIQRIEVVNRDLSATLAKICGKIDDGAIESQVLLMKKNKYRSVSVCNGSPLLMITTDTRSFSIANCTGWHKKCRRVSSLSCWAHRSCRHTSKIVLCTA